MRSTIASAQIRTGSKTCVVNVTGEVTLALDKSGVREGLALVSVPHTTCALCVNEDEPGLLRDLTAMTERLLAPLRPPGGFEHDRIDDNAAAHLFASLVGGSVVVPVGGGSLRLGTWQSILLLEADGPRSRRLDMTFLGT